MVYEVSEKLRGLSLKTGVSNLSVKDITLFVMQDLEGKRSWRYLLKLSFQATRISISQKSYSE